MEGNEAERRMHRSPFHRARLHRAQQEQDNTGGADDDMDDPFLDDEEALVVPEEKLEAYAADIKRASRVFGPSPGFTSKDIEKYNHRLAPTRPSITYADGTIVDWRAPLRLTRTTHRIHKSIERLKKKAAEQGKVFVDPRTPAVGPNAALIAMTQATSRRPITYPEAAEKMKDTGELPSVAPHSTALAHRVHTVDVRPGHLGGRKLARRKRSRRKRSRRKKTQKKRRKRRKRRKTRRKRRGGKTRRRRQRKTRRKKGAATIYKIFKAGNGAYTVPDSCPPSAPENNPGNYRNWEVAWCSESEDHGVCCPPGSTCKWEKSSDGLYEMGCMERAPSQTVEEAREHARAAQRQRLAARLQRLRENN